MSHLRGRAALLLLAAAIIPACGGNGGGRVQTTSTLPPCVIPGPGNLTVSAKGGEGASSIGGEGGSVLVAATSGSDLKLLCGAYSVDASFTPPEFIPYLGPNPRTFLTPGPVTLTTTVNSGAILGDDGLTRATGLRVGPGVLLTLTTNFPDLPALRTMAAVAFSHAIWIEGQVTTANQDLMAPGDAGSNNASALQLVGSNLLITAAAAIVTTGRAGVSLLPDGGNGGDILANIQGVIVNKGTFTATGADGFATAGNGGKGGRVTFSSGTFLYSTGNVTTNGGTGTGPLTSGGDGGQIVMVGSVALSLPAEHGGCFVRGTLSARGGNGTQSGGRGPSGPNQFFSGLFGVLLANQATPLGGRGVYDVVIDASGGDATAGGDGGSGASGTFAGVQLRAEGGTLRVKATITNRGGASSVGNCGNGGSVLIQQVLGNGAGSLGAGSKPDLEGGMAVAAAIDTGGGSGDNGGVGGNVTFSQSLDGIPSGRNPMILAGYKLIETSGGSAKSDAGIAGSIQILNHVHTDDSGLTAIGGILNQVELKALGGSGDSGEPGGDVTIKSDSPSQLLQDRPDADRSVTNSGIITTIGGGGAISGAPGGAVTIYDHRSVVNSAAITTNGGEGLTNKGGKAADIALESERTVCNSGPLTAIGGGSGSSTGGAGGTIRVRNLTVLSLEPDSSVCNYASLDASGGSGITGGLAGTVSLYAHLSLMNSGTLFADGGTGSAGNGGNGGVVSLGSDADLSNEAAAFARGGDGAGGNGGAGGFLFYVADRTTSHGNLTATGGNGSLTGGVGGFIQVYSATPPSVKTGTFSVAPGTGGTPAAGAVDVDGIGQPLTGGVITF